MTHETMTTSSDFFAAGLVFLALGSFAASRWLGDVLTAARRRQRRLRRSKTSAANRMYDDLYELASIPLALCGVAFVIVGSVS